MKHLLLVMALSLSFNVYAEKVRDQIHSLELGNNDEAHLVKLFSGRVAFIDSKDKALLKQIEKSLQQKDWLELTLGKHSALEEITIVSRANERVISNFASTSNFQDPYIPSVVSLTKATSIFNKMRQDYNQKGQCFNRAHIWTYEEYMRSKLNLNKLFLFFTSRYIRTYRFGWWFHVSPMAYVGGTKNLNMRVLDRRYTTGPRMSKTWTDIFIKSKKACKIVSNYSQYRDNQRSEDCFLIPSSMYYLVPSDLDILEYDGTQRIEYEQIEIEHALWDAFRRPKGG